MPTWSIRLTETKAKIYNDFMRERGFRNQSEFIAFCMDRMVWPLPMDAPRQGKNGEVVHQPAVNEQHQSETSPPPIPVDPAAIKLFLATNGASNTARIAAALGTDPEETYKKLFELENNGLLTMNRKLEWVLRE